MRKISLLSILLASLLLSSCGPSQAELDATATRITADISATQTATVPTSTPAPSPTPDSPEPTAPEPEPVPDTALLHFVNATDLRSQLFENWNTDRQLHMWLFGPQKYQFTFESDDYRLEVVPGDYWFRFIGCGPSGDSYHDMLLGQRRLRAGKVYIIRCVCEPVAFAPDNPRHVLAWQLSCSGPNWGL